VLGDIGKGESDPSLTMYGRDIPKSHAPPQYVLIDKLPHRRSDQFRRPIIADAILRQRLRGAGFRLVTARLRVN